VHRDRPDEEERDGPPQPAHKGSRRCFLRGPVNWSISAPRSPIVIPAKKPGTILSPDRHGTEAGSDCSQRTI
jgi:hypothetical protein